MTPRLVEIQIDALVLEGDVSATRHAVGEAFQAALERLMTAEPPEAALRTPSLTAAPVALRMDAPAQALGSAIATSVHQGLTR